MRQFNSVLTWFAAGTDGILVVVVIVVIAVHDDDNGNDDVDDVDDDDDNEEDEEGLCCFCCCCYGGGACRGHCRARHILINVPSLSCYHLKYCGKVTFIRKKVFNEVFKKII